MFNSAWLKWGGIALGLFLVYTYVIGFYNEVIRADESIKTQNSEIQNGYARMQELLSKVTVATKGFAELEQETFTKVADARGSTNVITKLTELGEQGKIDSPQLGVLIANAAGGVRLAQEAYPTSQVLPEIRTLIEQAEGSYNRISTSQTRMNEEIQNYNLLLREAPRGVLLSRVFGWTERPRFQPEVDRKPVSSTGSAQSVESVFETK
jgi:LemA protein